MRWIYSLMRDSGTTEQLQKANNSDRMQLITKSWSPKSQCEHTENESQMTECISVFMCACKCIRSCQEFVCGQKIHWDDLEQHVTFWCSAVGRTRDHWLSQTQHWGDRLISFFNGNERIVFGVANHLGGNIRGEMSQLYHQWAYRWTTDLESIILLTL